MGKNLVDEAIRLIKGDPPQCDNKPFRENESPRPVAVPDPAPSIVHKWSVADCPACRCYVVWENYPLGGGTRYFCGYGPVVQGKSKKVELIRLGECPAGGVMPKATEARQSPVSGPASAPPSICSDAELISRDLEYLNGISENLAGWSLWKRIEQGKEHRFALDAGGVIRWERWVKLHI